jgi:enterochelin esterase-like enzyme
MSETSPAQAPKQTATTTGEGMLSPPELQILDFPSRLFRNVRKLRVWLPPGYRNPQNQQRQYPVFYLNDGQNLFDPATSFTGVDWHVGQTALALILQNKVPPLVIVGIDNAQTERLKEYLPYRSFRPPVLRPLGRRYPDFLTHEVMPFIEQRFRIARGPENTGLGGSSLGGLITLYTVTHHPCIAGRVLVESPSLFVSRRHFLKQSRHFQQWPDKVYLGIGTSESGQPEKDRLFVEDVRELEQIIRSAGLGDDRLRVWIDEGAGHNEGEWAKRFPEALLFLFGS